MARFSLCNLNESKPVPVPVVNCVLLTSGIFRTGAEACAYAAFSLQSALPFRSHPPESEPCVLLLEFGLTAAGAFKKITPVHNLYCLTCSAWLA